MIQGPGANPIKLFTVVIYGFSSQVRVSVPGKPFQPSLILWVRPGAYPRVKCMNGSFLPALPASIRLAWKGLQGTKTAFLKNP
jgi:hypothetical protein